MMAWQPAQQPGDVDPLISDAKRELAKYSYGRGLGTSDEYTHEFGVALVQYGKAIHDQVIKGRRTPPDPNTRGVFDWAIKRQLGLIGEPTTGVITKPRVRHPFYVFRGTGGIIGQDPVSRVCQGAADLVEEINTPWDATMGGIPVGATQGGIGAASMWGCVQKALPIAQADFIARRKVNPRIKAGVGGYSAGDVIAALFEQWILDNFPENFLCGFRLGSPTRPAGGAFFAAPVVPWGNGIADFTQGDPHEWRTIWLTHEGDMYAQIPGGKVGEMMELFYRLATRFAFSDLMGSMREGVTMLPKAIELAGIEVPEVLAALSGGIPGLFGFGFMKLMAALPGLIPTGTPLEQLTGTAAAAAAARLALTFLFQGTGPHIRYEWDPVWPGGPTFVQLGVQHVRDWASRPENRTA